MCLSTAESRFGLDDGVARFSVKAFECVDEQRTDSGRQVRSSEEFDRVVVFPGSGGTIGYLLEIGGEFCLRQIAGKDVGMGANDVTPWFESVPERRRLFCRAFLGFLWRCGYLLLICRCCDFRLACQFRLSGETVADCLDAFPCILSVDLIEDLSNDGEV